MRLGPDTTTTAIDMSYRHFSGYNYMDTSIRAFSHTHLVGAGVDDLGNIGIMPMLWSGDVTTMQPIGEQTERTWWSTFNKSTEIAKPVYYPNTYYFCVVIIFYFRHVFVGHL